MCGTGLRGEMPPPSKASRSKHASLTAGGYSILGLSQESSLGPAAYNQENRARREDTPRLNSNHNNLPRADSRSMGSQPADPEQNDLLNRNLDYLFEEDESKHPARWRMYVALALLLIASAILVWQWQRNGYPWETLTPAATGHNSATAPASAAQAALSPQATPKTAAPPAAGLISQSESAKAGLAKPDPSTSQLAQPDAPLMEPQKAPRFQTASQERGSFASPVPASEEARAEQPRSSASAVTGQPAAQQVSDPVAPADENREPPTAALSDGPAQGSSEAQAVQLLTEGRKYLLGNGVQQDCGRANEDLRSAARFSSEAESLLGTMYASGHCVSRDLPTAYRWYARALRSEPANNRIQNDLTALWNEMTAAERQIASHSQP